MSSSSHSFVGTALSEEKVHSSVPISPTTSLSSPKAPEVTFTHGNYAETLNRILTSDVFAKAVHAKSTHAVGYELQDESLQRLVCEELGNVYLKDNDHYFNPEKSTRAVAQAFLTFCFSPGDEFNDMIDKVHAEKARLAAIKMHPSCISFIEQTVNGVQQYVLAVSQPRAVKVRDQKLKKMTTDLFVELKKKAKLFNALPENKDHPKIIILNTTSIDSNKVYSENFNKLVNAVSDQLGYPKPHDPHRQCSEKSYSYILAQIAAQHNLDFLVNSVTNYRFYAYEKSKDYDVDVSRSAPSPLNRKTAKENIIDLGKWETEEIPCCQNCQQLRIPILVTLTAVKKIARAELLAVKEKNKVDSPEAMKILSAEKEEGRHPPKLSPYNVKKSPYNQLPLPHLYSLASPSTLVPPGSKLSIHGRRLVEKSEGGTSPTPNPRKKITF